MGRSTCNSKCLIGRLTEASYGSSILEQSYLMTFYYMSIEL